MSTEEQRAIKADYAAIRNKTRSTPNGHPWDISDENFDEAARRGRYKGA